MRWVKFIPWLVLLFGGAALAQQIPIDCATSTACTSGGPTNTKTGDTLPVAGTKINTMTAQIFAVTGITQLALSTYSGVNCNGTTDSHDAVVSAFAAAIAANQTVMVDCPVFIHTGLDYTKAIFVNPGLKVNFTPSGYFAVDNVCTATFVGENTHDVTWINTQILYQGNFALLGGIDANSAPCQGVPNNLNDVTIKNYLIANYGNTFGSGGSSLWPGPTNRSAVFQFDGNSYRLNFIGGSSRAYVADSATAGQFIPTIFSFGVQWNAGLTGITSGTTQTTANSTAPYDVIIDGWDFDGFLMGIVGQGNIRYSNSTAHRYSDLQDGTTGTVTFSGTLSSGATSGVLSTSVYPGGWSYPTGTYALGVPIAPSTAASGTGSVVTIAFSGGATIPLSSVVEITGVTPTGYNGTYHVTASSAGSVSFHSTTTGAQTIAGTVSQVVFTPITNGGSSTGTFSNALVANSSSAVAYSGNVGGIGNWFAPPHNMYMISGTSPNYQIGEDIDNIYDYGIPVFPTGVRRTSGSGSALSLKVEVANNTVVNNYTTLRPDGCFDVLSYGNANGSVTNFYCSFDSAISTEDGVNSLWGIRFPNPSPFTNLTMDNIQVFDTAAEPTQFAVQSLALNGNSNVSITREKIFENDWPAAATWYPGFQVAGSQMNLQAEIYFAACNSTQTYRGFVDNQGTALATNSNFDIKAYGFRQFNLTFNVAPTGTSTALASNWNPSSGTYTVTFSDGEIRYVTLSNGAGTATWSPALTGTPTVNANAGGALGANYAGYRNRVTMAQAGPGDSNRAHFVDVSNGLEQTVENGIDTESWTQNWFGTPTGSTFTLPITFPAYFSLDREGYAVTTALDATNGLTGVEVGWAGSPTALIANGNISTTNVGIPAFSPIVLGGSARTILLTPVAGTFGTTGVMQYSVRGTTMFGAP